MSNHHVQVRLENDWYIGRVLERPGITTQGRTLDELVFMVRDAITVMWDEKAPSLELVLAPDVAAATRSGRGAKSKATRKRSAG